jgi:hypothetical protein
LGEGVEEKLEEEIVREAAEFAGDNRGSRETIVIEGSESGNEDAEFDPSDEDDLDADDEGGAAGGFL